MCWLVGIAPSMMERPLFSGAAGQGPSPVHELYQLLKLLCMDPASGRQAGREAGDRGIKSV
jgi:hypothetical protein